MVILLYHIILANRLFDSWLEKVDTMHFLSFDLQVMLVQRVNIIDRRYVYCPQVFFFKLLKTCFYIKLWFEKFFKKYMWTVQSFIPLFWPAWLASETGEKMQINLLKPNITYFIIIFFQHQVEIIIVLQAKPTGKVKELF